MLTPSLLRPSLPEARGRRRRLPMVGLCAGLVAVLGALALPFAPVEIDDPVVTWPVSTAAPASTLLPLEAGKPLGLSGGFSCRAVAAAGAADTDRAAHVLFATTDPDQPGQAEGLRIIGENGVTTAFLGTSVIFRDPVPGGSCEYGFTTNGDQLEFTRDGVPLGASAMPDVDALITSISRLTGPDLGVTVRVDDRFASSPSLIKIVLMNVVGVCASVAIACLVLAHRRRGRRRRRRVDATDLVVGGVLVAWLFLAPMSTDDGWMYAMAANQHHTGFFGNYYMYHNNSYVPFTWLLWLYSWWLNLGTAPVLLRIPSLLFALVTWLAVRGALGELARGRRIWLPALVFLTWWVPFGLGARQEASVAACLAVTVASVLIAIRRQRPVYLGFAVASASLGLIAHTAGVLGVLPLLFSGPAAARLIRRTSPTRRAALTTVLGIATFAATAAFGAFCDGSLNDFLRGSSSFGGALDTGPPDPLHDEFTRYQSLLGDTSLGSFALRTPVLLLLLVLPFFVVLCVRARLRRRPLPRALWLSGWSCATGLVLLVITPSKWTWHFGAFAGVGTVFLSAAALSLPRLSRSLIDRRVAMALGIPLLALTTGWIWLSAQGRNSWADEILPGVPLAGKPLLSGWLPVAGIGTVIATSILLLRKRRPHTSALTAGILMATFLAGELTFLIGGFAMAAVRTTNTWSPWADAITDPLARRCGEARVLQVANPDTAQPTQILPNSKVAMDGFDQSVYFPGSPPAPGPATSQVFGNLPLEPGQTARMTTPWYRLPAELSARKRLMTTVSGHTGQGNSLTAEFATGPPTAPQPLGKTDLTATEDDLGWRDIEIPTGATLPTGATAFRLTAVATQGWFSFAAPSLRDLVPTTEFLPRDGRTLVDWQLTWLYPCQGQPILAHGIVAPVSYVVGAGFGPTGTRYAATNGGTWSTEAGGLLASQSRAATMTRMYTTLSTNPDYPMRTVYRLAHPYADNAYRLTVGNNTAMGWQTPG